MHQLPYHSGEIQHDDDFERLEERYMEVIKRYDRNELNAMSQMLAITLQAHQEHFSDFLGAIAAEQSLLNEDGGQFFTPYALCRLTAQMSLTDARETVEQKGLITIGEPASGGGAMIIAAAEALKEQGLDPRSCAQFDATDVSRNAYNMTYIQLSAQNLQAIVRHGNSLSMEMYESRPTPQLRSFDKWLKEKRAEAMLLKLRDFIVNPDGWLGEEKQVEEQMLNAETVLDMQIEATVSEAPEPTEQTSLFDMDTFAPAEARGRATRRKPDVTLPRHEQLGLFSQERESR